jgi:glycosyltransferase involved in cell wall biosynthesis
MMLNRAYANGPRITGVSRPFPDLILHVVPGGLERGGGIGRVVSYIIDAWGNQQLQADMRVLDTRGPGHISLSPCYFAYCLMTIALLAGRRPLLHVHVAGRGSTIRKIILVHFGRLLNLPIVLHLHDYDYRESLQRFPRVIQTAVRSMFAVANQVVVLGRDDRKLVVETLGVASERVAIVPNAVPAPPQAHRPINSPGYPVHILFLGNPSRRKGLHDLITALAIEPLRGLDWRMSVAGGGNEIGTFQKMSHEKKLSDRINFTGWLDRTKTAMLLKSSDIVVLPSYAEGMAMSVLEGMSYGLCVICTPVGSLKYVIENEVSGLLVEPGDVEHLAGALARAVTDSQLRNKLGAGAARVFAEKFDAARFPDRLKEIYGKALLDTAPYSGKTTNHSQ